MTHSAHLQQQFGNIDIYLYDQLLKGRFDHVKSVLDAGCGGGRNLVYFLANGFDVFAVDQSPQAVAAVRRLAATLAPALSADHFEVASLEELPYSDESFDAVICNAVLHFVTDEHQFDRIMAELWRVLKPGGIFFARLSSVIGLENRLRLIEGRRYQVPDGSELFLVDEAKLMAVTANLSASLLDPLKTTNVQNLRCMTTWALRKA